MSKSTPSLLALLGLAAFAGYQNRDKLSDMLSGTRDNEGTDRSVSGQSGFDATGNPQGGLMGDIGRMFSGGAGGGMLAGGISDLVERFKDAGRGTAAQSWVSSGPNETVEPSEIEHVVGSDTVDELAQKAGLSRAEVLQRLAASLPEMVNRFTPDGRVPTQDEAQALITPEPRRSAL